MVTNYVWCPVDKFGAIKGSMTKKAIIAKYFFRAERTAIASIRKHNACHKAKKDQLAVMKFKLVPANDEEEQKASVTEGNYRQQILDSSVLLAKEVVKGLLEELNKPENVLYHDYDYEKNEHFNVIRTDKAETIINKFIEKVEQRCEEHRKNIQVGTTFEEVSFEDETTEIDEIPDLGEKE